jgi:hypothetical protein
VLAGHSSHVTNLRWLDRDTHLISVGGNDKCILQWRATWGEEDEDVRTAGVDVDSADEVEIKRDGPSIDRKPQHEAAVSFDFEGMFQLEGEVSCATLFAPEPVPWCVGTGDAAVPALVPIPVSTACTSCI